MEQQNEHAQLSPESYASHEKLSQQLLGLHIPVASLLPLSAESPSPVAAA